MRDHRKLRAFELADQLALTIYRETESFPRSEQFGLTSQLRRGAVSIGVCRRNPSSHQEGRLETGGGRSKGVACGHID